MRDTGRSLHSLETMPAARLLKTWFALALACKYFAGMSSETHETDLLGKRRDRNSTVDQRSIGHSGALTFRFPMAAPAIHRHGGNPTIRTFWRSQARWINHLTLRDLIPVVGEVLAQFEVLAPNRGPRPWTCTKGPANPSKCAELRTC